MNISNWNHQIVKIPICHHILGSKKLIIQIVFRNNAKVINEANRNDQCLFPCLYQKFDEK